MKLYIDEAGLFVWAAALQVKPVGADFVLWWVVSRGRR